MSGQTKANQNDKPVSQNDDDLGKLLSCKVSESVNERVKAYQELLIKKTNEYFKSIGQSAPEITISYAIRELINIGLNQVEKNA